MSSIPPSSLVSRQNSTNPILHPTEEELERSRKSLATYVKSLDEYVSTPSDSTEELEKSRKSVAAYLKSLDKNVSTQSESEKKASSFMINSPNLRLDDLPEFGLASLEDFNLRDIVNDQTFLANKPTHKRERSNSFSHSRESSKSKNSQQSENTTQAELPSFDKQDNSASDSTRKTVFEINKSVEPRSHTVNLDLFKKPEKFLTQKDKSKVETQKPTFSSPSTRFTLPQYWVSDSNFYEQSDPQSRPSRSFNLNTPSAEETQSESSKQLKKKASKIFNMIMRRK